MCMHGQCIEDVKKKLPMKGSIASHIFDIVFPLQLCNFFQSILFPSCAAHNIDRLCQCASSNGGNQSTAKYVYHLCCTRNAIHCKTCILSKYQIVLCNVRRAPTSAICRSTMNLAVCLKIHFGRFKL